MNSYDSSSLYNSSRRSSRRRKKDPGWLYVLLGALTALCCVSIAGFALFQSGYLPIGSFIGLTSTAIAQNSASCQVLIDRALQASDNSCGGTGSNQVCYGNITIQADLVANATQRFSERGDIIPVNELQRLSAAPLNLNNEEWGIAVFKILANLPRSLPGQTVTMVVFGNANLENVSGNLESFYFTSELGQIVCQKVPYDGMMINTPDGTGIRFNINGAEMTLMGSASIQAIKNGLMEISIYEGSGRIVSNGEEQYFGAGQQVNIQLGGADGNQSISGPSDPLPLSQDELNTACTMLGQFCIPEEIVPVSPGDAQNQLQAEITFTPTPLVTDTATPRPTDTLFPTNTSFVLAPWTPSRAPRTSTPRTPVVTDTRTLPPNTFTPTRTPTFTPTFTSTFTPTFTQIPTSTPQAPADPFCPSVTLGLLTTPNANELAMDITNNSGGPITINRLFAYWVKLPTSQKLDKLFLDGNQIWNISDTTSPSDIPSEGNFSGGSRTIPHTGTQNFVVQFQDALQPTGYQFHIVFDIGCKVVGAK